MGENVDELGALLARVGARVDRAELRSAAAAWRTRAKSARRDDNVFLAEVRRALAAKAGTRCTPAASAAQDILRTQVRRALLGLLSAKIARDELGRAAAAPDGATDPAIQPYTVYTIPPSDAPSIDEAPRQQSQGSDAQAHRDRLIADARSRATLLSRALERGNASVDALSRSALVSLRAVVETFEREGTLVDTSDRAQELRRYGLKPRKDDRTPYAMYLRLLRDQIANRSLRSRLSYALDAASRLGIPADALSARLEEGVTCATTGSVRKGAAGFAALSRTMRAQDRMIEDDVRTVDAADARSAREAEIIDKLKVLTRAGVRKLAIKGPGSQALAVSDVVARRGQLTLVLTDSS